MLQLKPQDFERKSLDFFLPLGCRASLVLGPLEELSLLIIRCYFCCSKYTLKLGATQLCLYCVNDLRFRLPRPTKLSKG